MLKLIAAKIEDGRIVPTEPLPEPGLIRGVSILVEMNEPSPPPSDRPSVTQLFGLLKGAGNPSGDDKGDYINYLERKYR